MASMQMMSHNRLVNYFWPVNKLYKVSEQLLSCDKFILSVQHNFDVASEVTLHDTVKHLNVANDPF